MKQGIIGRYLTHSTRTQVTPAGSAAIAVRWTAAAALAAAAVKGNVSGAAGLLLAIGVASVVAVAGMRRSDALSDSDAHQAKLRRTRLAHHDDGGGGFGARGSGR